jgi:hypothetical protein
MSNLNTRYRGNMKYIYIIIMLVYLCLPCDLLAQPVGNMGEMVSEVNGTIRESYFAGANNGIVVHIQDLHCNYDAQISIYNIINELIDRYNLGLVAIEGCVGELDAAGLFRAPDGKANENLIQYYLKSGRIDGASFAHVMRHGNFVFWGADDRNLYDRNLNAYKKSIKGEFDNARYHDNIMEIIETIKVRAYTKALKKLDENITAYKNETLGFSDYIKYLDGLFNEKSLKSDEYPNFRALVAVMEKESAIDFLEVDNQRSEYVDMLSQRLSRERLSELLDKSLYFKTGKISPLLFYSYLEDTAKSEDIEEFSRDYPQLALYISYIKLYSDINNTELFREIEAVEKAIKDKLFTNDDQRRIDRVSYNINILGDMFSLKLTTDTLQYYRANRQEFNPAYIINFLSDTAKKYNVHFNLDPAFRSVAARLPDIEQFYHVAQERDSALVENTINSMRKNKAEIAVLVAGGFHTDGITRLLKDKMVSYIVVTPNITRLSANNLYRSVMLGEKDELSVFIDKAIEYAKYYD